MRAGEAIVYLDEMIVSRDASFWVRGLPAFYTPIAGFAIGPRRTGFLIPRFGYANSEGFILRQPFFWAISPSQDLTVTGILRTERGFEFAGLYRYILAEDSRGNEWPVPVQLQPHSHRAAEKPMGVQAAAAGPGAHLDLQGGRPGRE
jgi:lipopolysaccharide assembly outer membrane protein LptD (OstA)